MTNSLKGRLRKILPAKFILFYHKLRAILACLWYRFPGKKLTVIGVTGTNGKTTTVNLIGSILEEAGFKVGLASTINFRIGKREWENVTKMTTISPFALQKLLAQMVKEDCQYAVIETTSHAVVQYRIWGIPYDLMAITNLTHEHLDYHKTMTEYRETKGQLFAQLTKSFKKPGVKKVAVLNKDDPSFDYFWQFPADLKFSYQIGGTPKDNQQICARRVFLDTTGSRFDLLTTYGETHVNLPLPGRFNIENALAAISVGVSQNIDLARIKKGLEKIKGIPGRMERIEAGQGFDVIVDYAHTPDALQKIYETARPLVKGRIISVFGAAGDRDKTKRPIMGALAGKWADLAIVTNEDPYTEDPEEIIDQVAAGIPRGRKRGLLKEGRDYFKILDRKEAIRFAFKNAKWGDLVLITGKGAEQWMVVGDKKVPWDDRKVARELLSKQ